MPRADPAEEMSISRASGGDARLIAALATVTFYETYFEQDDPRDMANYLADTFAPEKIAAELADPNSYFFIAYRRGRAVGYAKLRGGEPHESVTSPNPIELQRIYLVERVWGTGAGSVLLQHCLEFARALGKDALWLGVWEENPRALAFYEKHGFRRVGTLEFPYGDTVGVNAVMRMALVQ